MRSKTSSELSISSAARSTCYTHPILGAPEVKRLYRVPEFSFFPYIPSTISRSPSNESSTLPPPSTRLQATNTRPRSVLCRWYQSILLFDNSAELSSPHVCNTVIVKLKPCYCARIGGLLTRSAGPRGVFFCQVLLVQKPPNSG